VSAPVTTLIPLRPAGGSVATRRLSCRLLGAVPGHRQIPDIWKLAVIR